MSYLDPFLQCAQKLWSLYFSNSSSSSSETGCHVSSHLCPHLCPQVFNHLESHNGVRQPVRGEAAEYTLEVVKYDKDNKGETGLLTSLLRAEDFICCCACYLCVRVRYWTSPEYRLGVQGGARAKTSGKIRRESRQHACLSWWSEHCCASE